MGEIDKLNILLLHIEKRVEEIKLFMRKEEFCQAHIAEFIAPGNCLVLL